MLEEEERAAPKGKGVLDGRSMRALGSNLRHGADGRFKGRREAKLPGLGRELRRSSSGSDFVI